MLMLKQKAALNSFKKRQKLEKRSILDIPKSIYISKVEKLMFKKQFRDYDYPNMSYAHELILMKAIRLGIEYTIIDDIDDIDGMGTEIIFSI